VTKVYAIPLRYDELFDCRTVNAKLDTFCNFGRHKRLIMRKEALCPFELLE
jgi:hypothetical protein